MTESNAIDRSILNTLLETVGGDVEFLNDLVGEYLDDSRRQFAVMRQALADRDCEALRRAAHSQKSNSATFGATQLSTMCRELEYMGRDAQLAGAAERIAHAELEFERVRVALEAATEG